MLAGSQCRDLDGTNRDRCVLRVIAQIGAGQAHHDPDLAERVRDRGAELGDAHGDGVDRCEAAQQAARDGLAEGFQGL